MSNPLKLAIIGIDAATWNRMDPWLEAGEFPHLASLIAGGCRSPLRSIIPPSTACAWPAIMTGMNPAKTGMTFFVRFEADYLPHLMSNADRRAPALWDLFGSHGLSVGVYNVPITYPPDEVNGYMVSGEMGAVGYDASMFQPPELFDELHKVVPRYEIAPVHRRSGAEFDLEALRAQVNARRTAAAYLLEHHPTDVFITVINYVDHLQHRFTTERRCGDIEDILLWGYRAADEFVGEVLSHCGEDTSVIVLSDHGAGPVEGFLDLNALLAQMGYLRYHEVPASRRMKRAISSPLRWGRGRLGRLASLVLPAGVKQRLKARVGGGGSRPANVAEQALQQFGDLSRAIDWSQTLAYSAGPYLSIRLNLRGREEQGQVAPQDFETVRDQLIAELNAVENPFTEQRGLDAHPADELYHGPHMQWVPDILGAPQDAALMLRNIPGNTQRTFLRGEEIWPGYPGKAGVPGTHRMTGILACKTPGRKPRLVVDNPTLVDVAPTALALLGLPLLSEMDGQVLLDLPDTGVADLPEGAWPSGEQARAPAAAAGTYSEEDAAKVEKRLKDLGYL